MSKQEEEQHRQEVEHADETKTKNNKTKLFSHTCPLLCDRFKSPNMCLCFEKKLIVKEKYCIY